MDNQAKDMPDLKYSEENFRDMYEALKECLNILDLQRTEYNQTPSILPRNLVGEGPIAKMARKALAKANGE